MKIYEALAKAFHQQNLGTCFALLGDANMHWAGALSALGTRFIYTRHEHAAVAAATSYARASGEIGFATVTCGPGLTQIMTILPIAVRANLPLIIFAGEAPLNKQWYNQKIDQEPFVTACGAKYRALHNPETMITDIDESVDIARQERCPVVIGVPFDLQKREWTGDITLPKQKPEPVSTPCIAPLPEQVALAASLLAQSQRPIILAGLGATSKAARSACCHLAELSGALLATTLPAKGLFHDQAYCLGVAGGYSSEQAKQIFRQADLVIAIGSRLASHTFDGGKLTPNAKVIHIDIAPQEHVQGRKAADVLIKADSVSGTDALCHSLAGQHMINWRTEEMKATAAEALALPEQGKASDGYLHPLSIIKELNRIIPPTCHIINTSGHCAYFSAQMNNHPQDHFTVIRDFGAIGNGTSFALGIAELYPDRPVILIDGDGSAMMHIQELETMQRHNLHILTIVLNDGGYGSEIHKLRADGIPLDGSVFGRPDFAGIGRGFGLTGETFTEVKGMEDSLSAFLRAGKPAIWDIHISNLVASPQILNAHRQTDK